MLCFGGTLAGGPGEPPGLVCTYAMLWGTLAGGLGEQPGLWDTALRTLLGIA